MMRNPKIGLAGVMCTPFRGDKEGNFRSHRAQLEDLAEEFGFEFLAVEEGIYNLDQANAAAAELEEWGADFILLQASSFAAGNFVYPFTELEAYLGLWAVPEGPPTSEGGLPLNSYTAANMYNSIIKTYLTAYQKPVKWFFGDPGQPRFDRRLEITVGALRVVCNLERATVGLIGGVAPSFDNLIIDENRLRERLGVNVVRIEFEELIKVAQAMDRQKAAQVGDEIRATAAKFDESQTSFLEKAGRVDLALNALAKERGLDAVAVSCWPRFQTDYNFAVCTVMGHLNTQGLIASCEGDVTSAVSMLALRYMTGGEAVTLMDLVAVDEQDESVLLWHCGPTSPAMADENGVTMKSLWLFDGPDGERTGLHNDLVLKSGRGTVMGFTVDFDHMLVLDGVIDNEKPSYAGSRGWLKQLRMNAEPVVTMDLVQSLMASGFQHHYPFTYGNLSEMSLELCAWLGVSPIRIEKYTAYLKSESP